MAKKKAFDKIGSWLFLLGVVVAIACGILAPNVTAVAAVLAAVGLIVGLANITAREVKEFLIATIALIVAGNGLTLIPVIGNALTNIVAYLVALVAPAAVIVALVAVWNLAKDK